EQILSLLQRLREEREELLGLKSDWDKKSERLLRQTEVERQLVVSECERLRQFLAKQERLLLAWLAELDEEMGRRREENATHLGEEISRLSALITELEGKCQQPVLELLQVRLCQMHPEPSVGRGRPPRPCKAQCRACGRDICRATGCKERGARTLGEVGGGW
ncbi:E3 ubiquitin-protein ligase TRIM15-like, partial [Chrysemys picta bellii]|uniref:E3 ubiquitin-protein ligase TRIM15-like n=1 Tax=Chrysemys picta bellii TaxID=8478 RepID=UPI0032B27D2B